MSRRASCRLATRPGSTRRRLLRLRPLKSQPGPGSPTSPSLPTSNRARSAGRPRHSQGRHPAAAGPEHRRLGCRWQPRRTGHHADHRSNYLSLVYTDWIAELGAKPPTGTVDDSFDNALAEAVNGGSTRRSSFAAADPGARSRRSSSRPSSTCGVGTTSTSTENSTTAPRSRSSRRSTLPSNNPCQQPLARGADRYRTQAESRTCPRSSTIRTARSRTSTGYRFGNSGIKSGTVHSGNSYLNWRYS